VSVPSPTIRTGARPVLAILAAAGLLLAAAPGAGGTAPPLIAVVLSRDLPAYREALRGFEETLTP
jgi:hypothetical protein